MLARKFTDPRYSVAAWIELIKTRQQQVRKQAEADGIGLSETVIAARQDIQREDLRAFDNSVRSWLKTADEVKAKERKQLDLIIDNIGIIPIGASTYTATIDVWKAALVGFEAILNGKPQQVTEGAILLAISAWHIYPNLIVLAKQTKTIDFNDKLVPRSGALTIGMQWDAENRLLPGFQWSLTLSHLTFYGDPIEAIDEDNRRINTEELGWLIFGGVLALWHLPPQDAKTVAACIVKISTLLKDADQYLNPSAEELKRRPCSWLSSLTRLAQKLLHGGIEEVQDCEKWIRQGYRRLKRHRISRLSAMPQATVHCLAYAICMS